MINFLCVYYCIYKFSITKKGEFHHPFQWIISSSIINSNLSNWLISRKPFRERNQCVYHLRKGRIIRKKIFFLISCSMWKTTQLSSSSIVYSKKYLEVIWGFFFFWGGGECWTLLVIFKLAVKEWHVKFTKMSFT